MIVGERHDDQTLPKVPSMLGVAEDGSSSAVQYQKVLRQQVQHDDWWGKRTVARGLERASKGRF